MGLKLRSIHVVNSNIEKVSLCLSNCQMTDENIHDLETDFYILQSDNVISIYSTYFEENFNIKKYSNIVFVSKGPSSTHKSKLLSPR